MAETSPSSILKTTQSIFGDGFSITNDMAGRKVHCGLPAANIYT